MYINYFQQSTHEKSYADAAEDAMRRDLVAKCKAFVEEHNKKFEAGEVSFTCGLNNFSDRTEEEKSRKFGCGKIRRPIVSNNADE